MKTFSFILLIIFIGFVPNAARSQEKDLGNDFFVFRNAFHKKDAQEYSYKKQAHLLKKWGYDGIEHHETEGLLDLLHAMKEKGLRVYTVYVNVDIDKEQPYNPEWKKIMPSLQGTNMILWVHIHSEKFNPSDSTSDALVVPVLQELADLANPYGIKIAIYPHVGFLAERAEDSYRLAQKSARENIGSVFNLCHFLKTDSEDNLEKVIDLIYPKLFAVSISGANSGDTKKMNWDELIQPLGIGSFDVYPLVKLLIDKGYNGPLGLQCYNLKGSPEIYLKQSIRTWKAYKKKLRT